MFKKPKSFNEFRQQSLAPIGTINYDENSTLEWLGLGQSEVNAEHSIAFGSNLIVESPYTTVIGNHLNRITVDNGGVTYIGPNNEDGINLVTRLEVLENTVETLREKLEELTERVERLSDG